jgi:hypothetical protein
MLYDWSNLRFWVSLQVQLAMFCLLLGLFS